MPGSDPLPVLGLDADDTLWENEVSFLKWAVKGLNAISFFLVSILLFIIAIGNINSMLMSVTERVREIGTLKCLGALDFFILQTYFIESSLMGVIGTIIGIIVGILVALAVALSSYHSYVMAHFPWMKAGGSVLMAFIIGTLISVVASIAPAYWAARKQPVEALSVEE